MESKNINMDSEALFENVYNNFKLHFYREIFHKIQGKETSLTTVESFCMEVIYALDHPTISEFGSFIGLSTPNIAYKIANLVRKGYLKKIQSEDDKREYRLEVTSKYIDHYNISSSYMKSIYGHAAAKMSAEERESMHKILQLMYEEEAAETPLPRKKKKDFS